ncbi:red chlorophyll catabolite reductase, chloroplastic [Tanacetum coccineum]
MSKPKPMPMQPEDNALQMNLTLPPRSSPVMDEMVSGLRWSKIDFILGSWLHCELPTRGALNIISRPTQTASREAFRSKISLLRSLYIPSVVSPTAILVRRETEQLEKMIEPHVSLIAMEVLKTWLDICAFGKRTMGDSLTQLVSLNLSNSVIKKAEITELRVPHTNIQPEQLD